MLVLPTDWSPRKTWRGGGGAQRPRWLLQRGARTRSGPLAPAAGARRWPRPLRCRPLGGAAAPGRGAGAGPRPSRKARVASPRAGAPHAAGASATTLWPGGGWQAPRLPRAATRAHQLVLRQWRGIRRGGHGCLLPAAGAPASMHCFGRSSGCWERPAGRCRAVTAGLAGPNAGGCVGPGVAAVHAIASRRRAAVGRGGAAGARRWFANSRQPRRRFGGASNPAGARGAGPRACPS
jgi:hypothetical protein